MLPLNSPAFNLSLPQRCQPDINRTVYMVSTLGREHKTKQRGDGARKDKSKLEVVGGGGGGQRRRWVTRTRRCELT